MAAYVFIYLLNYVFIYGGDSALKKCKKIGEGVYGEVFALNQKTRPTVLKIMPIEGDKWVNGEKQKTYEEILSELVIAV